MKLVWKHKIVPGLRLGSPFRHSVIPLQVGFVLRSSRNPLTLNQTGLVAVTFNTVDQHRYEPRQR